MEEYKKNLMLQRTLSVVGSLILAAFVIIASGSELADASFFNSTVENEHFASMWRGFLTGASCGLMALLIINLLRIRKAMRSEEELRKLYIKDHDERTIQIWTKARAVSTQISLLGGLVSGVVAGYFSMTVSITIIACTVAHSLVTVCAKIYYNAKL